MKQNTIIHIKLDNSTTQHTSTSLGGGGITVAGLGTNASSGLTATSGASLIPFPPGL